MDDVDLVSVASGKIVLVTGGTGGIGAATVRRLAELGATVVAADIDAQAGAALARELGPPHRFVQLDVADIDAWRAALDDVVSELGGLDTVVLNAGVMLRGRGVPVADDPIQWLTPERIARVVDVNLWGVVNGFVAALPHLEARGGGHVIMMGAIVVLAADPPYTMTKQAVLGFARSVAPSANARGVTVACLQPNAVDTPIVPDNVRESGFPLNPPSRVADAVLHMLAKAEPGEFWLMSPPGDPEPPYPYEFPPLPEKITRTSRQTDSLRQT